MTPAARPLAVERGLDAHYGRIAAYVASLVRDSAVAEELSQEVFLRAHRRRDSLRDPGAMLPWLYTIATRVCLDHLRRRAARPPADGELDPDALPSDDRDAAPELRAAQGEMSECVQDHVAELGDRYCAVLLLHDAHGLTLKEIAGLLGISTGAAKMRLHRARRRLEESLRAGCDFSRDERGVVVCEPKP